MSMTDTTWEKREDHLSGVPHQGETVDCGVYMLMFADLLSMGQVVDFHPTREQGIELRNQITKQLQEHNLRAATLLYRQAKMF